MKDQLKIAELQNDIRDYLASLTGEEYQDNVPIPDLSTFAGEKVYSQFVFKILTEVGKRLAAFAAKYGDELAFQLIQKVLEGKIDGEVKRILDRNFKQLQEQNILMHAGGITDIDSWLAQPYLNMWDRFLVLIGVSPWYSDILAKYFGTDGLVSLGVLLKSLLEGHLDITSALYAIDRETRYAGQPSAAYTT